MLKSLFIQNYAIIDQVTLDLVSGFNVITGETGAGKSILLGALNLIMGSRADTRVLYDQDVKCIVEATFHPNKTVVKELAALKLIDKNTVEIRIKREISSTGKSRAYINDNSAKLMDIKLVATKLVDIHNQFDTMSLTTPEYQIEMVDAIANNRKLLDIYKADYNQLIQLRSEVQKLEKSKSQSAEDLEFVKYQLEELDRYPLDGLDKKSIEEEYATLTNAEEIKIALSKISQTLIESETGAENQIRESIRDISSYVDSNSQLSEITQFLEEILDSLRDVDTISNRLNDNLEVNEERVIELQELLDHINFLESKHNVATIEELLGLRDMFAQRAGGSFDLDALLKEKRKALADQLSKIGNSAGKLTKSRTGTFKTISTQLEKSLVDLAMPNAQVQLECQPALDFGSNGKDEIALLFSSNKGIQPQLISEVASGGEMSRLALSAKSMIAELYGVSTLIFDEIDTGISGAVALKVGQILNDIAFSRQVLCITHSPQVASIAQQHYFVSKRDTDIRTITNVELLDSKGRILEIAKMLSTDPPSKFAIQNAKELIKGS